jgi:hexosaminidase
MAGNAAPVPNDDELRLAGAQLLVKVCDAFAYKDPWGTRAGYSKADLQAVVAYARARGVRVMPEFDLPGHIELPLCSAEPELCVKGCAPDPSKPAWWAYLKQIVTELGEIFPDNFFHGGADEFRPACWLEDAGLKAWASAHNLTSTAAVLDYFHTRWQSILLDAGKRPMFWDEFFFVYDGDPPTRTNLTILPGTTASVRGISNGGADEYANDARQWNRTLAAGIPAINTGISEAWYLDRAGKTCSGQSGNDPKASYFSYWWMTWQTYYSHDPYVGLPEATFANTSLMLGGEVDMWGEGVDDTNFTPQTFPATSAVAERMWSGARRGSLPGIDARLREHRCSLVRMGLSVPPVGSEHVDGPGPPCNRL